jgi:hypothetical protein
MLSCIHVELARLGSCSFCSSCRHHAGGGSASREIDDCCNNNNDYGAASNIKFSNEDIKSNVKSINDSGKDAHSWDIYPNGCDIYGCDIYDHIIGNDDYDLRQK